MSCHANEAYYEQRYQDLIDEYSLKVIRGKMLKDLHIANLKLKKFKRHINNEN